jgi:hypothetical protein
MFSCQCPLYDKELSRSIEKLIVIYFQQLFEPLVVIVSTLQKEEINTEINKLNKEFSDSLNLMN